jgi:hypothetical protein
MAKKALVNSQLAAAAEAPSDIYGGASSPLLRRAKPPAGPSTFVAPRSPLLSRARPASLVASASAASNMVLSAVLGAHSSPRSPLLSRARPASLFTPAISVTRSPLLARKVRADAGSGGAVFVAPPAEAVAVGTRVQVPGKGAGVVKFCGPVKFSAGLWAGVQLDAANGDGNGTSDGVRYFACKPKYAGLL